MAIDYKKEWEELYHIYGKHSVQDQRGIFSIATALDEVMNFQIRHTIQTREKLMEEYLKENIRTNIDGGDKDTHRVEVMYHGQRLYSIRIPKKDFSKWCEKKGDKNVKKTLSSNS